MDREDENLFDVTTVNFTWVTDSFEVNELKLKLNFSSPENISPLIKYDKLMVHFRNTSEPFFTCKKNGFKIAPEKRSMTIKVTPQM